MSTGRGFGASGGGGRREGRGGGRGNGGRGNSFVPSSSGRGYYAMNQPPVTQLPQYSSGGATAGGGPYAYPYSNVYSQGHQYSAAPMPPGYLSVYPHAQHPQAPQHGSNAGSVQYFHPTTSTSQLPSSVGGGTTTTDNAGGALSSSPVVGGGSSAMPTNGSYHPSMGMSLPNVQGSYPPVHAISYVTPMSMSPSITGVPVSSGPIGGRGSNTQQTVQPREKKILTIMDKHGNVLDLGKLTKTEEKSSTEDKKESGTSSDTTAKTPSSLPRSSLYEAALLNIRKKEEAERLVKEKEEAERQAKEKEEAERLAKEKEEAERLAKEKEEAERLAKEKEEAERLAKEKEEAERLAKEKEDAERLAKEKEEAERLAKEKEEAEKLEKDKVQQQKAESKSTETVKSVLSRNFESRGRKFGDGGGSLSALAAKLERNKVEKRDHKKLDYKAPDRRDKESRLKEAAENTSTESEVTMNSASAQSLRPGGNGGGGALRPGGGLRPGGSLRPGGGFRPENVSPVPSSNLQKSGNRRVFTKEDLLRFRDLDICCCRPNDLQDMNVTIIHRGARGVGGGRSNAGQWGKESIPNHGQRKRQGDSEQWARARTPPKGGRGRGRGRGGRGGRGRGGYIDDFEGPPPKPLVKSENRWMPVKDTNVVAITEKKVKAILNKMTKEKFEKLSEQMIEIPITSLEILTMMIHHVYEKAIFEPSFGDIYAELCSRLSEKAKRNPFVKIIESDEEPPTENGEAQDGKGSSSHNTVYRWSNDVSADDSEVIGPFESVEDCFEAALDADNCPEPKKRCSEMVLHSVRIIAGQFIKVMHPVDNTDEFYTVFFPVTKAKEIGQQISDEIFLSEIECQKNGLKKNSFKSILLNKCQDEFKKKDIYDEWRVEKKAYDEQKDSFSESERLEKEEDLEFRRMKIKKQMLGNIRFIGELFKIGMLKVKVMRDCIENLLRLSQERDADGNLTGNIISLDDQDMDEEDHEAVCKLFTTIGRAIDRAKYTEIIDIYFSKISEFSNDKKLSARCRFLYKDLIDLRKNDWVARRKEEKAKTLEEIKKDFEREERIQGEQQNQQSQQEQRNQFYRGMKDNRRTVKSIDDRKGGGDGDFRQESRDNRRASYDSSSRVSRSSTRDYNEPKADASGFFPVIKSSSGRSAMIGTPRILSRDDRGGSQLPKDSSRQLRSGPSLHQQPRQEHHRQELKPPHSETTSEPLSKEKLQLRAKNMRLEFMQDKNEEELLRSMDDLKATPNAGEVIVQTYIDAITECKIEEREAITCILSILYRNHKVTRDDISKSFAEIIEFLDSYIMDSPFALENVSCLMAELLHIEALDVNWLCSNVQKLQETAADLIPNVIASCLKYSIKRHNAQEARSHYERASVSLERLLTKEKWNEIKRKSEL